MGPPGPRSGRLDRPDRGLGGPTPGGGGGAGSAGKRGRLRRGEELAAFAATLGPDDAVALEASGNTWALVELLGRHAGRGVVSHPLRTRAIADGKSKTGHID